MPQIYPSVACNLDSAMLQACLPLFESEKVEGLEWSFDTLYNFREIPDWFEGLLQAFAAEGRLIGHGVFFSLFSGKWLPEQEEWLRHLNKISKQYRFDHVTEHFGFLTGRDFHAGAPISIPFTQQTLAIGRDRLQRIQEACSCPVGLENLAFSYTLEEVKRHGDFLEQLINPVNGFIILDLHNLYCQVHNFSIAASELLPLYPLDRVREIHISGGSWEPAASDPERQIRRDTHDEGVPEAVFELLEQTMPLCPNLKFVVMEQLGPALKTAAAQSQFQRDFNRMAQMVERVFSTTPSPNSFLPLTPLPIPQQVPEDVHLYKQQLVLSEILETAPDLVTARQMLETSILAGTAWATIHWDDGMLETAIRIAQKWKSGW